MIQLILGVQLGILDWEFATTNAFHYLLQSGLFGGLDPFRFVTFPTSFFERSLFVLRQLCTYLVSALVRSTGHGRAECISPPVMLLWFLLFGRFGLGHGHR